MHRSRLLRLAARVLPAVLLLSLAGAGPASASHLKGGHINATITADGAVTVDVKWFQRYENCATESTDGDSVGESVEVTAPDGTTTGDFDIELPLTRCLGSTAEYTGTASYQLNDASGPFGAEAPAGAYTFAINQCCRVDGIINSDDDSFNLTAVVRNVPGLVTHSPRFLGSTATGAAQGYEYTGDVTAEEPDSAADLVYLLLQRQDASAPGYDETAPATNVVTLDGTTARVPALITGGWNVGDYFVYKVRSDDAEGDSAQLDILVRVTDNRPPTLTAPTSLTMTAGDTTSVDLNATDPDNADPKIDTVTISQSAGPDWASTDGTDGNPATGTLALAPPAGRFGRFYVALDAVDDDPDVVLLDSKVIEVKVVPPKPEFQSTPPLSSPDQSPTFTFSGPDGATFECSIDGGDFQPCTSPYQPSGLNAGRHTLAVRSVDSESGVTSENQTYEWTIEAAVAQPASSTPAPASPAAPAPASPGAPAPVPTVCASTRRFRIHWRIARSRGVVSQRLAITGRKTRRLGTSARGALVNLSGHRAGRYTVRVTAKTRDGRRWQTTRIYRTCRDKQSAVRPLRSLKLRLVKGRGSKRG